MNFYKKKEISKVIKYSKKNNLYFLTNKKLFFNEKSFSIFDTPVDGFEIFNNKVYLNDWNGNYKIYKTSGEVIEKGEGKAFFHSSNSYLGYQYLKEGNIQEALIDKNEVILNLDIIDKKNSINFSNKNIYCCLINNEIYTYTLTKAKLQWKFELSTLGKFEDRDGNLQNYEVHKFIGAWQNSIVVACSGQLVLDINSKTGELNRKWQALPGYGSSAFQGRLQHKLPSTDGFQLDISKSYLYHLAGAYLVTIDLVTGKANYQTLKNTLEEHVFSGFRWSTGYAEDENHIYTIAEMNRMELGLDYTPQCIVAFNKKTLKIDWHYRFEGDWVKTDIPQRSTNKLYQLSGDNTLYIFEKEEKSV
ncbi:hypothetical protein [Cellulophaga sp. Z1A5H]|uniref:hypothetical protein n=1 Tax=Cellulophaga sp. Z1A5H TaxID=2687291 RepID=UPI0013FD0FF3|nr:hypothetical protein [Cellulophaga sp. Z1A5H]